MRRHGFAKTSCGLGEIAVVVMACTLLAPGLALGQSTPRCAGTQGPLVADTTVRQTPDLPEPAARVPYRDSVFGTCQMRVTDRLADLPVAGEGLKNEYSRVQAFNADETRVLVRGTEGNWYLYDVATLAYLRQLPLAIDPRWDASDPDLVYFSDGTRLMRYDLATDEVSVVHDFAADLPQVALAAVWTRYEGSPSYNGRFWGLMAQDEQWDAVAMVTYDQQQDQVLAVRELAPGTSLDSVTISPLGTYLLAYCDQYCEAGELGTDEHPCGLMVYDRTLTHGRGLLRIVGHSDTAVDSQGREVLVYQDIDTDHMSMLDLESGTVTELWPIDFSHTAIGFHFSGRASRLPGWALVSTYNGGHPTDHTWMDDQVFAVELAAGGRVARLAHTHSLYREGQEQDYWAEPQASVNRDFTRVVFASNWGRTGSDDIEMHMIELPAGWSGGTASCSLTCSAEVPPAADAGAPVPLTATAQTTGCSGQPTFDWDFGDGSAHSTAPSTTHTYRAAGTYQWVMTATVDSASCQRTGSIVVSEEPAPADRWLIPAVVHSPGVAGTQWRTTLTAVNDSQQAATLSLTFYPNDGGGPRDASRALLPGGTAQWPDVLVDVFGYSAEQSVQGALSLRSEAPVIATARTFNQTATGTFGQYLPALTRADGLGEGEVGVLANLTRDGSFRTNVGVLNLGSTPVTVNLRVYGSDGSGVGEAVTHTVPGNQFWQANDFLGPSWSAAGNQSIAYATVEVDTSGGVVWPYASVVDNSTGDPTTIPVILSAR